MPVDVERLGPQQRIELYVKPGCPYCAQAVEFFDGKGIVPVKYDAQNDPEAKARMLAYANGNPTVPALIVDGRYEQSGWGLPPRG